MAWISDRFGFVRPFVLTTMLFLVGMGVLLGAADLNYFGVGACIVNFSIGIAIPVMLSITAKLDTDGRYIVLTVTALGMGGMIGPGIVITDLPSSTDSLTQTAAEVHALGLRCLVLHCDVTDEQQVYDCVAAATAEFGGIDILFNNAGIGKIVPFEDSPLELWDRIYAINVRRVVALIQYTIIDRVERQVL